MVPYNEQIGTIVAIGDYYQSRALDDLTLATTRQYQYQLNSFYRWLGGQEPTAELAKLFLAELRRKGYKRTTVHSYYYALKPFLAYLGLSFKVKLKHDKRLPRYHSKGDIDRLLLAAAGGKHSHARLRERDQLIIKTFIFTGLRRAELLSLRCRDIRDGYLFVFRGKGDKDRVVPLTRKLNSELSHYIQDANLAPSALLFPIKAKRLNHIVKRCALAAGIDDLSPHGLRHYFATRLLEKGAALNAIQQLLGHEGISTTAVYLDLVPQHLRSAIDLLEEE